MTEEEFIAAFRQNVDGFESASLDADKALAEFPQWDSLAVLVVIAWVSETFRVTLSGREIRECPTLGTLWGQIKCKQATGE